MKKLKFILILLILLFGMNQVHAQVGKLKSITGSALDKKPIEKKTEKEADDSEKTTTSETKEVKKDVVPLGKYSEIKANMTDTNLENQGLALVNEKATNEKWNETYTKSKIVSEDWEVVKMN
jgi:hypothetical protein